MRDIRSVSLQNMSVGEGGAPRVHATVVTLRCPSSPCASVTVRDHLRTSVFGVVCLSTPRWATRCLIAPDVAGRRERPPARSGSSTPAGPAPRPPRTDVRGGRPRSEFCAEVGCWSRSGSRPGGNVGLGRVRRGIWSCDYALRGLLVGPRCFGCRVEVGPPAAHWRPRARVRVAARAWWSERPCLSCSPPLVPCAARMWTPPGPLARVFPKAKINMRICRIWGELRAAP